MSDNQTAAYEPKPVTQRDGSELASSNCRMASIAAGLAYHTRGGETSSGAAMRSYTSDQSGGTDSADAREAWTKGYSESLTIRDGHPWSQAVDDLRAGRLVHLDVWAATLGGVCLSGTGGYGHTIAVLPSSSGTRWKVSDPWCNPPKWAWVEAAKLQAASEDWGGQVYGRAAEEPDWPTGGIDPRSAIVLAIVARIVRHLMSEARPGLEGERYVPAHPPDTGGAQPILFTVTKALTPSGGGGGEMPRFVNANGYGVESTKRMDLVAGDKWTYLDGKPGGELAKPATVKVVGTLDSEPNQYVILLGTGGPYSDGTTRDTQVLVPTTRPVYDAPAGTPVPPPDDDVEEALAERDDAWRAWLLAGSPGEDPDAP
jgi:hypothetical protein